MNLNKLAIVAIILGIIFGFININKWLKISAFESAPIVTGHIVAKAKKQSLFGPVIDFEIQIEGTNTVVHSEVPLSKTNKISEHVRFHYSGDSSKQVFISDDAGGRLIVSLLFFGLSLIVVIGLFVRIKYDAKRES